MYNFEFQINNIHVHNLGFGLSVQNTVLRSEIPIVKKITEIFTPPVP